ncbi:hypothetical protein DFH07DRAFT_952095 [Mycena maculata]|uniref:Uncharacterized protein n=1 Tax=Mycena maculata TaxID=230809 RepID=A0AAD7NUP4_9AGAR|nr:hypothetical protein DFH07DRAFT_952095 [Mycena maculata]
MLEMLAPFNTSSVAYIAFYGDVEQVAVVESGHRVTLTYNLYFAKGVHVSAPKVSTVTDPNLLSPSF